MSRSTYIYVVMGKTDPMAAFTVKHELVSWIERCVGADVVGMLRIFRLVDNGRSGSRLTEMDVADLLSSGQESARPVSSPRGRPQG